MVSLRELQYLVALDEHQHFGRAAAACFVSQPTLSGQFRKFENRLGLKLVERHRHQVVITPSGQQLARRAKAILATVKEFEQLAETLQDPLGGDIHLGLVPTLAPYLLARIMSPLSSELPGLRFVLHEAQTAELLDRLDTADLDLLILPWQSKMATFDCFELFRERLLLATGPDDPLLMMDGLQLSALENRLVLTLQDGHCLRDDTMSYCFSAGAKEDQRFRATSLETLRFMVASGIGITLIPELAMDPARDTGIVYRHFSDPEPGRKIVALMRRGYPRMACVRAIVELVRRVIHSQNDMPHPISSISDKPGQPLLTEKEYAHPNE